MGKSEKFAISCLLCFQMLFLSIAGASTSVSDEVHLALAHQTAIDHHHHDELSAHFDHDDVADSHVHVLEHLQPMVLIAVRIGVTHTSNQDRLSGLVSATPPDVYLSGLLRPPQPLL